MQYDPQSDLAKRIRSKILKPLLATKSCFTITHRNKVADYPACELLRFSDTNEFIRQSYRVVLGRDPTPQCLDHHREVLLREKRNRADWLFCLVHSEEGKMHGVNLLGLSGYLAEFRATKTRKNKMPKPVKKESLSSTIRRLLGLPEAFQCFAEDLDRKLAAKHEQETSESQSTEERFLVLEAEIARLQHQIKSLEFSIASDKQLMSTSN